MIKMRQDKACLNIFVINIGYTNSITIKRCDYYNKSLDILSEKGGTVMEYKINSDLKFGDKMYICELFHQEEDGGFVTDPFVFEELVETIILREDGSVTYSTEPNFKTVEEGTRKEIVNFDTGKEAELKKWHLVTITEELK